MYEHERARMKYDYRSGSRRRYGFFHFLADVLLIAITHGLWIVWIIIREMRNR